MVWLRLYNAPGYTAQLDYNQPLTQGLLARNYIYMGGQQQVTAYLDTNCIPVNFTLQPFVYQSLDFYRPKLKKEIESFEKKVAKCRKQDKKFELEEKLENMKDYYKFVYGDRSV